MQGYILREDDLQELLLYRSKYQPREFRLDRRAQSYPAPRQNRSLPDTYSRTDKCGESRESTQQVSTCFQNLLFFYPYSVVEIRFSKTQL
ncbi:hypothetical protein ACTXT7_002998 [Hymenolepis weldensis]